MNTTLKKAILSAIGGGAIAIALVLIPSQEGREYKPYRDVAGITTVCDGHTGSDIVKDKTYTDAECDLLLKQDLDRTAKQVDKLITIEIPDTTRAALYSFAYNVGTGAFARSTLLKKLNQGDVIGACDELRRWVYAGGKKWRGLVNRREVDREVCQLQLKASP